MRHQLDLADQGRHRAANDGSILRDLASALAALAFCGAIAFIAILAVLPDLPA